MKQAKSVTSNRGRGSRLSWGNESIYFQWHHWWNNTGAISRDDWAIWFRRGLLLLFQQRLDRMFIIAWSISYTLFYFIRNREIIFKKSNQDWSIYIKKQRLRNCMKISCAICLFFLWQCRPKSVAQPAMRLVSPGFGQTLSEKLIYNLFFLWYNFIKNSKGYSSFAFWPVCRRITRSFLFRFYRYYFWVM